MDVNIKVNVGPQTQAAAAEVRLAAQKVVEFFDKLVLVLDKGLPEEVLESDFQVLQELMRKAKQTPGRNIS